MSTRIVWFHTMRDATRYARAILKGKVVTVYEHNGLFACEWHTFD